MGIEILTQARLNSKDLITKNQIPEIIPPQGTHFYDAERSNNITTRNNESLMYLFFPFIPRYTIIPQSLKIFLSTINSSQIYHIFLFNSSQETGLPLGQLFNTGIISGASPSGFRVITDVYYKSDPTVLNINSFKFIQNKKYWVGFHMLVANGSVRSVPLGSSRLIGSPTSTLNINMFKIPGTINKDIDKMEDLASFGSLSTASSNCPLLYWVT